MTLTRRLRSPALHIWTHFQFVLRPKTQPAHIFRPLQGAPAASFPASQELQAALAAAHKAAAAAVAAAAAATPSVPNPNAAQTELDRAGAQGLGTVSAPAGRLARPVTIDGRVPRGVVQAYAAFEAALRQAEAASAATSGALANEVCCQS